MALGRIFSGASVSNFGLGYSYQVLLVVHLSVSVIEPVVAPGPLYP